MLYVEMLYNYYVSSKLSYNYRDAYNIEILYYVSYRDAYIEILYVSYRDAYIEILYYVSYKDAYIEILYYVSYRDAYNYRDTILCVI